MESLFNCIVDFEETQYYIYKYSRRKFLLLFLNKHIYLLIFLKNIVFFFFVWFTKNPKFRHMKTFYYVNF